MPAFAICALVGVAGGLWVPVFVSAGNWPVALLLASGPCWWLFGERLLLATVAFALASLHGHWYQEKILPGPLVGKDLVVEGIVADLPRISDKSTSFLFRLTTNPAYTAFPRLVSLRIYAPGPVPKAGERWQFKVRLKRPASTVNSGGLDYESWLLAAGIHARGYVRNSRVNRRVAATGRGTRVLRFRSQLRDDIENALASSLALPLITGISIGARDGISPETWRVLRDSGTSHLVAISGLHIALIALACWWPGRLLGWLLHCLKLIAYPLVIARICVFLAACSYVLLAGFSVPTIRAGIMVGVVLTLAAMQRQRRASGVLGTALLIVLFIHPLSVLSGGFWLSFAAVALLYTFLNQPRASPISQRGRLRAAMSAFHSAFRGTCQTQLILCVGLALPTWLLFAQVSLIAPLANLIAVPLFSFWILPATLSGVLMTGMHWSWGNALLKLAAVGLSWLIGFLERLVTLPAATWQPGHMAWASVAMFCFALLVCLLPRPFPGRLAGLVFLAVFVRADNRPAPPPLRVHVLDVGQGLAVLVQTSGHSLLYDTGGAWWGGDAGESIIAPALAAAGLRDLDVLLISHDDTDHRGGSHSILRAMRVGRVLASGAQDYPAAVQPQKCRRGMHWEWDGVSFDILHPASDKDWSENDGSCVLMVRYANSTLLMPGDIEAAAEFELLRHSGLQEVDLVLGPHHGSRTSSGAAFVRELSASFVVFSAGYANRWGFPVAEVVQRWVDAKACALTTADAGALEFVPATGGGFRLVTAARSLLTRPWPVRNSGAAACISTINGVDGTV